ncbi:MAG: sensor protein KdpD [Ignavibacteria bacterium]|nr:sensor protein KdpD [Ignavibacteria bacterium]MBK7444628.1 sensor protein KdpD [Ignavibacteria bacterium]
MNDSTINPVAEKFLELIKKSRNGKFKIYIGLAAGVGKSYRMLLEAHELQKNKIDILVGYIETHGREETQKLMEGLPFIPRKIIYYKGKELEEFDIDKVIKLRPEVVIMDELAHTNAPGSRHEKRYQDAEELLYNGINVISALNIQHIESLNRIVQEITGVEVKETVPDKIIALADEVVNIDLTADELINRLQAGKIYKKDKIESALNNFFKKENLLQLRELALREVADQVEKKINYEIPKSERYESDRILVCIGNNHKKNEKIIRQSYRIADRLDSYWNVLYVETPDMPFENLELALQRHLINNFKMATELGAVSEKVKAVTVVDGIAAYISEKEITKVVVGRPDSKFSVKKMFAGNFINKLIDAIKDKDCDLEIIT